MTATDPRRSTSTAPMHDDDRVDRLGTWSATSRVMTRRNLVHIRREPMQLSDVTIQPVLFVGLFVYVFGSGHGDPGRRPTRTSPSAGSSP